ncbi:MAG: methyltransferase [Chitinophagaceae bacterium]
MLFGFAASRAIGVTAELCIADLLKDAPKTAEELAKQTNVHARSLYRLLRVCASISVFSEDSENRFSLTPLAEPLLSDAPGSLRAYAAMITSDWVYPAWAELSYTVKTGKPAFEKVFGMHVFEYFERDKTAAKLFDDAMTSLTAFGCAAVVNAYDFSSISKLVDVGGGKGLLLASIFAKYPNLKGVLFDTPTVVSGAETLLAEHGVRDRCETVGGNFFESVPGGGDAYILKTVIHDWNDEECITILKNCRKAVREGGKVLIVEELMREGNEPSMVKFVDLLMMVVASGCERTEREYRRLFDEAGFKLSRIVSTMSPFSIIEGICK